MSANSNDVHSISQQLMIGEFPIFTKLSEYNRGQYETIISRYPPVADFSFVSILQWFERMGEVRVAKLGGNIVVSHWDYAGEEYSGLSLMGTDDVDMSLCKIFDFLRGQGFPCRAINVPDFVIHSMQHPQHFSITPSQRDDEYIISVSRFADIHNLSEFRRLKIKQFMRSTIKNRIELSEINTGSFSAQMQMTQAARLWRRKGVNSLGSLESEALEHAISGGHRLGVRNVALFIDGELVAYCLYHQPADKSYAIIDHARVNYDIPHLFDYMLYAFAVHFRNQGINYANIYGDFGAMRLRVIKLALKPVNFFRKYTVEPLWAELRG